MSAWSWRRLALRLCGARVEMSGVGWLGEDLGGGVEGEWMGAGKDWF